MLLIKNMLRVYGTCSHSPWWIYIYTHITCVFLWLFTFLSLSLFVFRTGFWFVAIASFALSTYIYISVFVLLFYTVLFYKNNTFFPISIDVCLCISISFPNGIVLDQRYECGWIEHFSSFVVLRLLELCCNNTQLRLKWIPMEWKRPNKRNNTKKQNKQQHTITGIV